MNFINNYQLQDLRGHHFGLMRKILMRPNEEIAIFHITYGKLCSHDVLTIFYVLQRLQFGTVISDSYSNVKFKKNCGPQYVYSRQQIEIIEGIGLDLDEFYAVNGNLGS